MSTMFPIGFIFFPFFSFYRSGKVRLQTLVRPNVIKINAPSTTSTPKQKTEKTPSPLMPSMTTGEYNLCPWSRSLSSPFRPSSVSNRCVFSRTSHDDASSTLTFINFSSFPHILFGSSTLSIMISSSFLIL
jgi:hypothetical protein